MSRDRLVRSRLSWLASAECWAWPGFHEDRYLGPFTADTANTVLIAQPTYDPATPIHGAEALRALLPDSSLLIVEGWGHTTLFLSTCADAAIAGYFLTGVPPADGTVCTQDFTPFLAGPTAASTEEADELSARAEARRKVMSEIAMRPGR